MKKLNKKVILAIVALVLLLGAGGYTIYAKDLNAKVEATQVAYHNMVLPDTSKYNDMEKTELDVLLTERQVAFEKLDVISLREIQEKFNLLDKKINARIKLEHSQKLYADKKSEIEMINIVEGAKEEEKNIFNGRKAEALQMVADMVEITIIDAKILELKQTNTDIENRKTAESNLAASSSATSNSGYYDDSDDYYYGGGENPSTDPEDSSEEGGKHPLLQLDQHPQQL